MKRAHTVALVAALYLVSIAPSYSQDIFGLIQNMAGRYAVSWADLETRRAQLESELSAAATQRKITAEQAADFRADLAQLTTDINQNKASGRRLGMQASIAYSSQLSTLATGLADAIQHKLATLPDIDAVQIQLKTQIDAAATSGKMSAPTAVTLRAELQQIAAIEAAYKADSGLTLTTRQIELLSERLSLLKAKVEQEVRIGESAVPALNDRRAAIEVKIAEGITTGKITATEAATFRQELATLANQQATFQASGSGILTGAQVLTLAQGLDRLDDRVGHNISGGPGTTPTPTPLPTVSVVEIDRMHERLARRIDRGIDSGRLTQTNANAMLRELDRLGELQAAYQASAGGISYSQVDRLRDDLDELNERLEIRIGSVPGGPGGGGRPGGGFGGPGGGRPGGGFDGPDDGYDGPGHIGGGSGGTVDIDPNHGNNPHQGTNVAIHLPVIAQRSFSDVRGYWGEPYVNELASRDVIGGFPNGSFGPNDDITRAQFAAIVVKALGLRAQGGGKVFVDVPSNHWAANAIATASNAGLIGGFPDGTFGPAQSITRAQALVILSKALGSRVPAGGNGLNRYSDANAVPSWAQASINQSANANIIVSFPDPSQIRPNATATRGEVAGLMYQTLNALGANLPAVRIGVMASNH